MRRMSLLLLVAGLCIVNTLSGCNGVSPDAEKRWYTNDQVEVGGKVFASNCAQCHGRQAQGLVKNWKQRLADGSYPAPPLNGSAHAWHHPLPLLLEIVQQGGALYDGKMPGFKG
ncbi:MAG: cytochrome c, partial [Mariprofundus sp.]